MPNTLQNNTLYQTHQITEVQLCNLDSKETRDSFKEWICMKHLEQCPAYSNYPINVRYYYFYLINGETDSQRN